MAVERVVSRRRPRPKSLPTSVALPVRRRRQLTARVPVVAFDSVARIRPKLRLLREMMTVSVTGVWESVM